MAFRASLLLSHCQLSESMGLTFLGFTVILNPKCLESTAVDTGLVCWRQLNEPRGWRRDTLAQLALQRLES